MTGGANVSCEGGRGWKWFFIQNFVTRFAYFTLAYVLHYTRPFYIYYGLEMMENSIYVQPRRVDAIGGGEIGSNLNDCKGFRMLIATRNEWYKK